MPATVPDTRISKADHSDTHRICPPFGGQIRNAEIPAV